jgi:Homeodomain-like domain
MLVRSRETAAAGGRGAQATHRGPIGAGTRPAAHHDRAGVAPASALTHARILLKANQGEAGPSWTDAAIGAALEVNPATVARVRMRYVAAGLEAAVYRKPPARSYRRRLDGEQEARLVALTCSAPPQGHKRWTLRLLADRLVELQVVESVSYETVRQALKQTGSSRG